MKNLMLLFFSVLCLTVSAVTKTETAVATQWQAANDTESLSQGKSTFWLGADVSGTTMEEKRGTHFYNAKGEERDNMTLMRELGMNAARLRVWVNPKDGWCNKDEVLQLALRAKQLNMEVMLCFHYSDSWADPGKQFIPEAWKNYSYEKMKRALANHTTEVCQLLKRNGIDVRWVQVGNETTHGFLWPVGRAEENMVQYAGLTEAGCKAAKRVFPNTTTIVHLDGGCDLKRYNRIFDALKKYGVQYDMIGMSVYPYWDLQANLTKSEGQTLAQVIQNIKTLHREYGKETMIVETGYEARRPNEGYAFMQKLIAAAQNDTEGHCHGVFYWAPELEGHYPLGAFVRHRPTAILDAFTEAATGSMPGDTTFYSVSKLDCRSKNGRIWGRLYLPYVSPYNREGRLPVVIMAHGFNATHQEPLAYAEVLAKHGIAAYVFDFCGGSMRSLSEGKTTDMNIFTEREDLEAITATIKRLPNIDPSRVALLGCSQGGLVASITAGAHPTDYAALILIYPALGIPNTAEAMLKRIEDRPDEFEFWGMKLSKKYYEPLVGFNPYDVIGSFKRPVVVVYGDEDNITPEALIEQTKKTYPQAKFRLIKGGQHGFPHPFHHREAEGHVLDFVRTSICR